MKICYCSQSEFPMDGHYHCIECDCILGHYNDSETTCCWCLERIKKGKQINIKEEVIMT